MTYTEKRLVEERMTNVIALVFINMHWEVKQQICASYSPSIDSVSSLLAKTFVAHLDKYIQQAIAEERERVVWVKYKDKKPVIGQLVIFYRDIESRQINATKWTKEEENYADWNEITHWMPIEYPGILSSLDKPLTDKE